MCNFTLLNKEEFLQQYVLNRANTSMELSGFGATFEAIIAWNEIKKATVEIEKENKNGK